MKTGRPGTTSAGPAVGKGEVVLPPAAVPAFSQAPLMVLPSSLNLPVKRCRNSSGVKSGDSRKSVHTLSAKVIAYSRTTPRES